ncbi:MAG: N-acetyltransferase [Chitinophagaceae bacterium]|nr:MAG: N-acetyltransferase [Chitinophagaceae bacterium]
MNMLCSQTMFFTLPSLQSEGVPGIGRLLKKSSTNFCQMQVILQTARLYLRCFNDNDEDAALILHLNSQPGVLQYLHEFPLLSVSDARSILQTVILPQYENKLGRWAVHLKDSDEFIGWCGLKFRPERNETDLGYRLLPSFWGNGYASEAAKGCLKYAFEELGLAIIHACAHKQNTASLSILTKIGMHYTGDEIIDHCPVKCFEITKQNYSGTSALA